MHTTPTRPSRPSPVRLPLQALPVDRDRPGPPAVAGPDGVTADRSPCSGLTGLAQQMCYATRYGIDT